MLLFYSRTGVHQEKICRLDIAMVDPRGVYPLQSFSYLSRNPNLVCGILAMSALDGLGQGLSLKILHDDEQHAFVFTSVVNLNDIRMAQAA